MKSFKLIIANFCILLIALSATNTDAGIIKNIWNKVTQKEKENSLQQQQQQQQQQTNPNPNSRPQYVSRADELDLSIPFCGNKLFSSSKDTISPEIIFITKSPAKTSYVINNDNRLDRRRSQRQTSNNRLSFGREGRRSSLNPVTYEFRFHAENVTLNELLDNGFNPDAPISFLIHGFTSGYPLQGWMTAMVEAYTIDQSNRPSASDLRPDGVHTLPGHQHVPETHIIHKRQSGNRWPVSSSSSFLSQQQQQQQHSELVSHNLFIVNWHYASRGPILYPRAVANIVPVSKYVSDFINIKLIGEARIPAYRIQLVGHSLGAHLAGFIGKATTNKVGRIFGLDPAGPCFGQISGPLYPKGSRLAPDDAEEVVSIHTNYELLGIEDPVGKYSVYIEGGKRQPGCDAFTKTAINSFSPDGPDFDKIACSHSRAPNLLTYQLSSGKEDNCMMVAYECDSWDSFKQGFCGNCDRIIDASAKLTDDINVARLMPNRRPTSPVECIRIGLEWQYRQKNNGFNKNNFAKNFEHPNEMYSGIESGTVFEDLPNNDNNNNDFVLTRKRRDTSAQNFTTTNTTTTTSSTTTASTITFSTTEKSTTGVNNSTLSTQSISNSTIDIKPKIFLTDALFPINETITAHKVHDDSLLPLPRIIGKGLTTLIGAKEDKRIKKLYMRTSNTQPYCTFHYQVILELSEPFSGGRKPPMSLVLQDARENNQRRGSGAGRRIDDGSSIHTTLSSDEFGNKFDDLTYTHLLTSSKKLNRVQHASLIFRNGLPESDWRKLKTLTVNYMSHVDPRARRRLSNILCLTTSMTDQNDASVQLAGRRFYFAPCNLNLQGDNFDSYGPGRRNDKNRPPKRRPARDNYDRREPERIVFGK